MGRVLLSPTIEDAIRRLNAAVRAAVRDRELAIAGEQEELQNESIIRLTIWRRAISRMRELFRWIWRRRY